MSSVAASTNLGTHFPQPPVASRNPTDWGRYQETYQRAYQEEHWARLQREVAGGRDPLYALWRFGDKEVADFLGKPENYPFINRVTEEIQRKTGPGVVRGERQQDWAVNLARESALRREEIERQALSPGAIGEPAHWPTRHCPK
jgi:hypothetical protein